MKIGHSNQEWFLSGALLACVLFLALWWLFVLAIGYAFLFLGLVHIFDFHPQPVLDTIFAFFVFLICPVLAFCILRAIGRALTRRR